MKRLRIYSGPFLFFTMTLYKNHTDEELMSLIQGADEAAFNELYQRYSQRLLYFLYRMLGQDEAKAQDFLQDLFLKIVSAPEKFDPNKRFKTWVFTVAANLCKNSYRSKNKPTIPLAENHQTYNPSADINLDAFAFKKDLLIALDQLLPVYKEAFVLRYQEGFSLKEIAIVTNSPLGTIKSRLHSATRLLSEKLTHYQSHLYEQ